MRPPTFTQSYEIINPRIGVLINTTVVKDSTRKKCNSLAEAIFWKEFPVMFRFGTIYFCFPPNQLLSGKLNQLEAWLVVGSKTIQE